MIVSVSDLKAQLRIGTDGEDSYLESLSERAQSTAETYCRVTFADDDTPPDVKMAIILMASHFYEVRDSSDPRSYENMMRAFHALLYPHRDVAKMF